LRTLLIVPIQLEMGNRRLEDASWNAGLQQFWLLMWPVTAVSWAETKKARSLN
jgi:hypothetical protein